MQFLLTYPILVVSYIAKIIMSDFSSNSRFRSGDRSDRPMFDAICADCGNPCKVPFNPTGEKPVYCSDCFDRHRESDQGRSNNGSFRGNNRPIQQYNNRTESSSFDQQFKELLAQQNKKLDEVIALLTIISGKKTVRVAKKEDAMDTDQGPAFKVVD